MGLSFSFTDSLCFILCSFSEFVQSCAACSQDLVGILKSFSEDLSVSLFKFLLGALSFLEVP